MAPIWPSVKTDRGTRRSAGEADLPGERVAARMVEARRQGDVPRQDVRARDLAIPFPRRVGGVDLGVRSQEPGVVACRREGGTRRPEPGGTGEAGRTDGIV